MSQVVLKKWRPHLRAAKKAGVSLSRYAREHGLSRHTLYAALRAERDGRGLAPRKARGKPRRATAAVRAAFVPVVVDGGRVPVTVRLPSGVVVECSDVQSIELASLIAALAALPCSA
jgi:transposase